MINVTKRVSAALCAVLMMLCTSICVFAESTEKLTDDANLFTLDEKEELTAKLEDVSSTTDWDVIIYTNYNDVGSYDMEDYCNEYYDNHNYGKGEDNRGVFLTVDMGSREMYIITKGDAMDYFSDERVDEILDDVAYNLSNDDYYEAAMSFVSYTRQYYRDGKPSYGTFSNVEKATEEEIERIEKEEKENTPALYVLKHYGIIIVLVALAIAALSVVFTAMRYKNNGKEGTYDLHANSKTMINDRQDIFLHKSVSVTTVSDSSSSGRSSGSSSGGGSSSHGGGGRSF